MFCYLLLGPLVLLVFFLGGGGTTNCFCCAWFFGIMLILVLELLYTVECDRLTMDFCARNGWLLSDGYADAWSP